MDNTIYNELIKVKDKQVKQSKDERDAFEDSLHDMDRLVRNILDVVNSYGIADHVHDHVLDKVDKHFDQNGITRDTYQYFVGMLDEKQ